MVPVTTIFTDPGSHVHTTLVPPWQAKTRLGKSKGQSPANPKIVDLGAVNSPDRCLDYGPTVLTWALAERRLWACRSRRWISGEIHRPIQHEGCLPYHSVTPRPCGREEAICGGFVPNLFPTGNKTSNAAVN